MMHHMIEILKYCLQHNYRYYQWTFGQ